MRGRRSEYASILGGVLSMRDLIGAAPVRMAPMASYTNAPFRAIARHFGAGFSTNEEIDAEALLHGNGRTAQMAAMFPGEGPVAMQLLGSCAETLVPAALRLVEAGASIIDINMGCPATKAVRRGKGAALMRDVPATARILEALRGALDGVPLTIKIRGGWDDSCINAVEVARMAEDVGVDAITVHPRTRSQQYAGRAPWQIIADVVQAVSIPVTGNGDVRSPAEAERMIESTGCAGVMIGRGALGRPWVFDPAHEALGEGARVEIEAEAIDSHLRTIEEWLTPRDALAHARRQLAMYATGHPEANALRARIFRAETVAEAHAVFAEARTEAR